MFRDDYIHCIPRRVSLRPTLRSADEADKSDPHDSAGGFARPEYHRTAGRGWPVGEVVEGDTIWLMSQLSAPWGSLPPALDARIDVSRVTRCKSGTSWFSARRSSFWFPLQDGSSCIDHLRVVNQNGSTRPLLSHPSQSIGQALQTLRRLAPASSVALREHADAVNRSLLEFVSYRHVDGTRAAFDLVQERLACGAAVYWDRWSLPRRLTERREEVCPIALTRHLHRKIRSAALVWGGLSLSYLEPKRYAAKEMRLAMSLGSFVAWEPEG